MHNIRIATRKSPLALWQAEHVKQQLLSHFTGLTVELVPMSTQGDKILDVPLAKIGGKGLFVKELESGLQNGEADIAVHSMKDVPMDLPDGLILPVIMQREEPFDAFVSGRYASLAQLPQGAKLGTSSLRRQCQIKRIRPDLNIHPLRGNLGTRLQKLDEGGYDAIILAQAGLIRLNMAHRVTQVLHSDMILPAVGQGAIGIECRAGDTSTIAYIQKLNHQPTELRVLAERAFNRRLHGGCQVPIAGFAELSHGVIFIRGLVGTPDGAQVLQSSISGHPKDAEELGDVLAQDLLARGAGALLTAMGL